MKDRSTSGEFNEPLKLLWKWWIYKIIVGLELGGNPVAEYDLENRTKRVQEYKHFIALDGSLTSEEHSAGFKAFAASWDNSV